jgi:hypothetical protein
VVLNVTQTRVTGDGVALFAACHPDAIKIEHEENFWALSFIRKQMKQVQTSATRNGLRKRPKNTQGLSTD